MRTASEIYTEYRIPPWLQLHQLRVAGVGQLVSELNHVASADDIVAACLLHDMGAIVKFDFSSANVLLGELFLAEDVEYWLSVQREFHEKFGKDEHPATDAVLREIGVRESVRHIVASIGFAHLQRMITESDSTAQIVQYADSRVGPRGVISLEERLEDLVVRYARKPEAKESQARYGVQLELSQRIETRLFANSSTRPEDITDARVEPLFESLRSFPIL